MNKERNAGINDDFSGFSVLFGIDDDDDDDCSSFPSELRFRWDGGGGLEDGTRKSSYCSEPFHCINSATFVDGCCQIQALNLRNNCHEKVCSLLLSVSFLIVWEVRKGCCTCVLIMRRKVQLPLVAVSERLVYI